MFDARLPASTLNQPSAVHVLGLDDAYLGCIRYNSEERLFKGVSVDSFGNRAWVKLTPGAPDVDGCGGDSYDISGTVDGEGSKGALHGLTKFSMEDAPANSYFSL